MRALVLHSYNYNYLPVSLDLFAVRRLANPPYIIMLIMDCVLLLFQRHLDPITIDKDWLKPSWAEGLKLMASNNFLPGLQKFPKVRSVQ